MDLRFGLYLRSSGSRGPRGQQRGPEARIQADNPLGFEKRRGRLDLIDGVEDA